MRPSFALSQHRDAIRTAVQRYRVSNPRVFGSALHGTNAEDIDLDLLVDPQEGTSLFDLAGPTVELQELLGVRVDVCTPKDLSLRFRQQVLDDAQPV